MRTVSHQLRCLNTWFLVGGSVGGGGVEAVEGGYSLLEERHHFESS